MGINFGRMAQGVATGYLGAAIKDREAKDNLRMKMVEAAGIDFHTNTKPAHEKKEALYAKDFENVAAMHGVEVANYFGDKNFFGDGNALATIDSILEKNNMNKADLKKLKLSTREERKEERNQTFQEKEKMFNTLGGTGGIGINTLKMNLDDVGKTIIPAPTDFGEVKENVEGTPVVPDATSDQAVATDISQSIFTPKADSRGVESKYAQVVKAIEEQNGYADTMSIGADGQANFTWGPKRKIAAAHAQFATMLLDKDKSLDQNTAASAAKRYLVFYTEKPFKELENIPELKGSTYKPGDGVLSVYDGNVGKIDINSVKYNNMFIRDYILEKIDNLPTTKGGNINEAIFQKFVENVPENLMDGDITFRTSLLAKRQTQELENNYFSLNN
tara:strand:- start:4591 stop:5757 length:1167 start_codon:yes stop_codon:yes gene_type:complete